MESLRVVHRYSVDDYVRGLTFVRNRNWFYRYSALMTSALMFSMFLFYLSVVGDIDGPAAFALAALIPAALIGGTIYISISLLNPWSLRRLVTKQIKGSPILQETNEIEFNDTGLEGTTFLGSGSTKWGAFVEVIESDEDLHFFTAPNFAMFVPKRALSENEIGRLRLLVAEKVGGRARLLT